MSGGGRVVRTVLAGRPDPTEPADYAPPPVAEPRTIGDRAAGLWSAVAATPTRAVCATLAGAGAIVAVVAARPVVVHTADARGPIDAHCGVAYYLFGHPNPVVRQACDSAYRDRGSVLVLAAVVALLAAVVVAVAAWPRARALQDAARSAFATANRAALATAAAVAFVVAAGSLRAVPVPLADATGPLTAHCGVGYYLFGSRDATVDRACDRAFVGHVTVFAVSLLVGVTLLGCLMVAVVRARRQREPASHTGTVESVAPDGEARA